MRVCAAHSTQVGANITHRINLFTLVQFLDSAGAKKGRFVPDDMSCVAAAAEGTRRDRK